MCHMARQFIDLAQWPVQGRDLDRKGAVGRRTLASAPARFQAVAPQDCPVCR